MRVLGRNAALVRGFGELGRTPSNIIKHFTNLPSYFPKTFVYQHQLFRQGLGYGGVKVKVHSSSCKGLLCNVNQHPYPHA